MSKVLLVTDYSGVLHITPMRNKAYYQGRNQKTKRQQFRLQEMDEEAAQKYVEDNKGRDPQFVKPQEIEKKLSEKDNRIADLEKQLAELKQSQSEPPAKKNAEETIADIKASTNADEVNKIMEGEQRATVIAAAQKKLAELKQS